MWTNFIFSGYWAGLNSISLEVGTGFVRECNASRLVSQMVIRMYVTFLRNAGYSFSWKRVTAKLTELAFMADHTQRYFNLE